MSNVLQFTPKATNEARHNVLEFIDLCRNQLTIFGKVDWEETWDVTREINQRGRSGRIALAWTNFDTSKSNTKAAQMADPFVDFARAYIRYQAGMKPTTSVNLRLSALRALERALSENGDVPDITRSNLAVFNRAATLIKDKFKSATAYRVAGQLAMVAKFINDNSMVSPQFEWVNNLKRDNDRVRIGRRFEEERSKRLPQSGAMDALAKAFRLATDPRDTIIAATGALLTTAPDRINELFRLPVDCEVQIENPDGTKAYGIRWWPSKGAEPYVKWIVPTMVDVAKEAIAKLTETTEHARSVARWYEVRPQSMWLPRNCEYLRSQQTSLAVDFAPALGMTRSGVNQWLNAQQVETQTFRGKLHVRFEDVEAVILKLLPKNFPVLDQETGLTYSEALFVVQKNCFHPKRSTIPSLVETVTTQHINGGLGARTKHGISSIFQRLGLKADDGSDIRVTTHQFRHWLNTIAQRGGLSQLDIAKWSGRKDMRQNQTYDHVAGDELLAMVRDIEQVSSCGRFASAVDKPPLSREEFLHVSFPTAHTTEFGFCVHDYSMMPCQKHRDCINCTEHVCVKGDVQKTHRIKMTLETVLQEVQKAEKAIADGIAGADRWFQHHTLTAVRLRDLVQMLDDPDVPIGSTIQLSISTEYSPIRNAIDDRKLLDGQDTEILDEIRALMGPKR